MRVVTPIISIGQEETCANRLLFVRKQIRLLYPDYEQFCKDILQIGTAQIHVLTSNNKKRGRLSAAFCKTLVQFFSVPMEYFKGDSLDKNIENQYEEQIVAKLKNFSYSTLKKDEFFTFEEQIQLCNTTEQIQIVEDKVLYLQKLINLKKERLSLQLFENKNNKY